MEKVNLLVGLLQSICQSSVCDYNTKEPLIVQIYYRIYYITMWWGTPTNG